MEENKYIPYNEKYETVIRDNNNFYRIIIKIYNDSFKFLIKHSNQIFKNYFTFNNILEQFISLTSLQKINEITFFIKESLEKNSINVNFKSQESIELKFPLNISFILNYQPDTFLKTNIKTIIQHTKYITQLSKLKDGRLISSSFDGLLNIYNKETFELELSIKEHQNLPIFSFTFLHNDNIITCSADETMNIIELKNDNTYILKQKLIGHSDNVCRVIEIKENELISVSMDKSFKVWILNNNNLFQCITNIIFQETNDSYCNILNLKKNEFVVSSHKDKYIKFYDCIKYSFIICLNDIETEFGLNMCLINDNILCIAGYNKKGFYLINISNHQIMKNIIGYNSIFFINKCNDGMLLCSIVDENEWNYVCKYKYENGDLIKKYIKFKPNEYIAFTIVELENGIFATGGMDKEIKIWKD